MKNHSLIGEAFKVKVERCREVKVYFPGKRFPSISLTGGKCFLNCKHCKGRYLKGMLKVESKADLKRKLLELHVKGAVGCLLSGGLDERLVVPIDKYVEVLRDAKERFGFIYNSHCGFPDREIAGEIAEAGIDFASVDFVGDHETVHEVYGLSKSPMDYLMAAENLIRAGVEVVPHICLGLFRGKVKSELKALKLIRRINPSTIVFIILTPTRGTPYQDLKPPEPIEVASLIAEARLMFPDSEINLGCMRPSYFRGETEILALESGVDGIVLPTKRTLLKAEKMGLEIRKLEACCAVWSKLRK